MASTKKDSSVTNIRLPYKYTPFNFSGHFLEQFRLLILLPGIEGSEICCEIQYASLTSPPPYEALSYTWGNPKGSENSIPCRGDADSLFTISIGEQYHTVGYNLICALRQLRNVTSARTLWVDALCINQGDDEERSYQVGMMATIYRRATQVIAWLGEGDKFTDLAFETMEELCWATKAMIWRYCSERLDLPLSTTTEADVLSIIESERNMAHFERGCLFQIDKFGSPQDLINNFRFIPSTFISQSLDLEAAAIVDFGTSRLFAYYLVSDQGKLPSDVVDQDFRSRFQALAETFDYRSYWSRLWILQELVVASEVSLVCGSRQMDLRMFDITYWVYTLHDSSRRSKLFSYLDSNKMWDLDKAIGKVLTVIIDRKDEEPRLAQLLRYHNDRICSEPRDRIYAMLQIAQPIDIVVNYRLSIGEVFTQTTRQLIRQEKKLDYIFLKPSIYQRGCPSTSSIDSPSWVPRFDTSYIFRFGKSFNAGGLLEGEFDDNGVKGDSPILRIQGYHVSKVRQRLANFSIPKTNEELWTDILILKRLLGISSSKRTIVRHFINPKRYRKPFGPTIVWDVFWNTLVMGHYSEDDLSLLQRKLSDANIKRCYKEDIEQALARISEPPARLLFALKMSLDGASFCMLENGYPALIHGDAKEGDLIFIARGASLPAVIRLVDSKHPVDNTGSPNGNVPRYNLVGGAYVDGIMEGEVIQQMEKGNFKDQLINLV